MFIYGNNARFADEKHPARQSCRGGVAPCAHGMGRLPAAAAPRSGPVPRPSSPGSDFLILRFHIAEPVTPCRLCLIQAAVDPVEKDMWIVLSVGNDGTDAHADGHQPADA